MRTSWNPKVVGSRNCHFFLPPLGAAPRAMAATRKLQVGFPAPICRLSCFSSACFRPAVYLYLMYNSFACHGACRLGAQAEIERTMKKVDEGIALFDDIWKKVPSRAGSHRRGRKAGTRDDWERGMLRGSTCVWEVSGNPTRPHLKLGLSWPRLPPFARARPRCMTPRT